MSTLLRSLLIDDEPAARLRMSRLLGPRRGIEVVGEASDGVQAVEQIEELRPDLIFLDIQLPGLDGFEVLRALAKPPLPLVIFVTAFDQHALQAFQAQALAYLLKPIEESLLDVAIDRAHRIVGYSPHRAAEELKIQQVLKATPASLTRIVARKGRRVMLIEPGDVCFFRMSLGTVRAHTLNDNHWVNYTLSELEGGLVGRNFFRAHRSTLVNLDQIAELRPDARSTYQLVMKDTARSLIDVSERQGRALRSRMPGL